MSAVNEINEVVVNENNNKQPIEKKTVEWLPHKGGIAQDYHSGLEYAFVSKDWKQCCDFIYCKDFLQDALDNLFHKRTREIYGFCYNWNKNPKVYLTRTRIALANKSDKEFGSKIDGCIDFVNQVEKIMHLKRTIVYQAENPPEKYNACGVWIFESSGKWQLSPPMLSMYTLLLRTGFVHKIGDNYETTINKVVSGEVKPYQKYDHNYLKFSKSGMERIIKIGYNNIFSDTPKDNYPSNVDISTLHHYYGIVSFSKGLDSIKNVYPQWFKN